MEQHQDVLARIGALRADLAAHLLERDAAIDAALLALVTGQHILLVGPPGTAKSALASRLCESIQGARYWSAVLTRYTCPEELFGPLSLSALDNDRYERVKGGTIVEAHVAFLDEVYKSNSAILNALLSLLAERIYFEGGKAHQVPLLSVIAASNELPEDGGLGALHDRFLLRVAVPYLAEEDSVRQLFDLVPAAATAIVTLDDIREAQGLVRQMPLTEDTREGILSVKRELEGEGIAISDRRWKLCGDLVRARAWLDGEQETAPDHLEVLTHALWTELSEIRAVERVVSKVANPLNLEAVELEDAAEDLYKRRPDIDHPQLTEALEPLLRQLADVKTRLETRIAAAPARRTVRARQSLNRVETWHRALAQLALRSLSRLHLAPGAA